MSGSRIAFVLAIVAASGCASFDPGAGFDESASLAGDRLGVDPTWITGSPDDELVRRRLSALLARRLEAEDVVAISLLNNLELQATYQELGIAQADVVQAGLLSNPALSFERRFPERAAELDVAQNFLDLLFAPLRQRVAGAYFEAAKRKVAAEVLRHAFEARLAYYSLQAKLQELELRRTVVEATELSAESARRLRRAGNIRLLDVKKEELLAAEARLESATTEGEVAEARERLNRAMGLWGEGTGWSIADRLPEVPIDDSIPDRLEPIALENRLDLAAARSELEALAESVGIARLAALLPDLTLTAHGEREPGGDTTTGPSITLPIPIFNWGEAASGQARARFTQAERRYAALAIEIRSEVRAAYARMGVARARAEFYRLRVLPLREDALRESQLLYNGMFAGVFELLEAKRDQIHAAEAYIAALAEYWTARTMLEAAVGRRIPPPRSADAAISSIVAPQPSAGGHAHHHS